MFSILPGDKLQFSPYATQYQQIAHKTNEITRPRPQSTLRISELNGSIQMAKAGKRNISLNFLMELQDEHKTSRHFC